MHERISGAPAEADSTAGADPLLADDPRVLQILSTEHWSLLSARSLAYNEAFTRASMFLSFLSMSFVALAFLTQAMGFERDFLVIAAIVLGFDLLIAVVTYARIVGTGLDDLRATQGMNRIRHGYVSIAPQVAPFFVTGVYDDMPSVLKTYGYVSRPTPVGRFAYGLSTSQGMVGLIMSLIGGVFAAVLVLLADWDGLAAVALGAVTTVVIFVLGLRWTLGHVATEQAELETRFPSPPQSEA